LADGQINFQFSWKPGRTASAAKSPAPTNEFREPLQTDGIHYSVVVKIQLSFFRKIMIICIHLALIKGRTRRHGRRAGGDGRKLHHLTRDAAGGRQKRVVLILRCWDQPPGQKPEGTVANKPDTGESAL
jgi:hypothetical protein